MEPMTEVENVLRQLETAWNRADGKGYAAPFAEDADFVDIRGVHHHGRGPIGQGHQAIFDTVYKGSKIAHRATDARAVAGDVIVAHGVATMETTNGMFDGRHAINTIVLVRSGDAWRIASFHNALADAT